MKNIGDLAARLYPVSRLSLALAVSAATIAAPPAALADAGAIKGSPPHWIVADSASPAAPPSAPSDKATQENMFWESAQRTNSAADYKAYLDAFPNGLYAPLARNRIATLSPPPEAAPPASSQPPASSAGLKAELGTMETEQSLNLTADDRVELQQRLQALGLYSGPADGNLGAGPRAAIGAWQKRHDLAPTGWLGPLQLAALKAESDAANQPPAGPAPAASAALANPAKAAQEDTFWESAQRSNTPADYQAYLAAFPNGLYAQMAKNRIASLNAGPQPGPGGGQGPLGLAALPPASPEALKAEVGTVETEQALNLGPPGRIEIQQRLSALGIYAGPFDGDLGPGTRGAIAEWQRRHEATPTGELGPLELAALRSESEAAYQHLLATLAAPRPVVYPVHHYVYVHDEAAPLGLLGGLALGILGARLGGHGGGGGGRGGGGGGGGGKKHR